MSTDFSIMAFTNITSFQANMGLMKSSCTQFGVPDPSEEEIKNIYDAICAASEKGGVPKEFIFAIMMQESKGCVRAPTTNWGVRNPGLMQDHNGKHTCNEGGVQNPCPKDQIFGMIDDGANGTPAGDGLKQTLAQAGNDETAKWYRAARIYNSGSLGGENLGLGIATHCYASDVANRLIGWVGDKTGCEEASIGSIQMSESFDRNKQINNPPSSPSSTAPAFATGTGSPTRVWSPTGTGSPSRVWSPTGTGSPSRVWSPSSTASVSAPARVSPSNSFPTAPTKPVTPPVPTTTGISKPGDAQTPGDHLDDNAPIPEVKGEHYPGAPADCKQWYLVKNDDFCQKVEQGLNLADGTLVKLNSGLNADCRNLWLDYAYCVGV